MKPLKELIEMLVISEMPISNFKRVGNWNKSSSFNNKVDRALLTSPRAVEKIHRQWENTPFEFEMYLINDPRVNKEEFREVGEVNDDFVWTRMGLTPEEFPGRAPGKITILLTNNRGDRRYMASGWILAHRLGHAFARSSGDMGREWREFTGHLHEVFKEMLDQVYDVSISSNNSFRVAPSEEKLLKFAAQQIGSMKSARDAKLNNWYEFAYEVFAQYLLTGKIKFNPLPDSLQIGQGPWGRKQTVSPNKTNQGMYNRHDLEYYAGELETFAENVLARAQGKIFVM